MIKKDNYQRWEPIKEDVIDLYFFELHNQEGSLIILLKKFELPDQILKIKFDGVLSYRVTVESGRLKTISNNNPHLGPFYIVDNSTFIKDLIEESGGIFEYSDLTHYSIWNSDNIIDIISGPPVEVEWITSK